MQTVSRSSFTTVKTEGAILPADLLQRVADGREVEGLRPEDYHLAANERLNEAISRSWNRLLGVWQGFDHDPLSGTGLRPSPLRRQPDHPGIRSGPRSRITQHESRITHPTPLRCGD
jgi:hypothetical protein